MIRVCLLAAGLMFMCVNVSPAAVFPQIVPAETIKPAADYPPSPPAGRIVGIAYSAWHTTSVWNNAWGTPQVSKDIEPSKEFGQQYLDLLKQQIHLFKAGK
jgi:hypothetical protein